MRGDAREGNLPAIMAGTLVGLLAFAGFAAMVLHHIYIQGSFLLDTGLLASLIWHGDPVLSELPVMGGHSYLSTHMVPFFLLLSALSRIVPLGMAQYFALVIGLSHALLALGIFWLLTAGFGLRRGRSLALAALLALAFAYSGLAIAIARYPHLETYVPAFFILFAVAFSLGHTIPAAIFFTLGLLCREDAGFHYFAVLFLFVALNRWRGITWQAQRGWLTFTALALLASLLALAVQKTFFPGDQAFARIYLGSPPFAHLTWGLVGERLAFWTFYRAYIVLPAAFACLWAWKTRNPYILLGWLAFIPWALVHFLATSTLAGFLASYYAFPFVIALFWPVLATYLHTHMQGTSATAPVGRFAITLALTFVGFTGQHNPGRLSFPAAFLDIPSPAQQRATDTAVRTLLHARPKLGRLVVDTSVAALAPRDFPIQELLGIKCRPPARLLAADVVVMFPDGCDATSLRAVITASNLRHLAMVPGTALLVASRAPLPDIPGLPTTPIPAKSTP